jgi:sucrose-6F-phosphate phosphohydrolase
MIAHRRVGEPISGLRLFSTDIDDTILGEPRSAALFKETWESIEADQRPLLVYNAGRSIEEVNWLVLEGRLPAAEFIIGGIGTEVFDPIDPEASAAFRAHIAPGWDRAAVQRCVETIPGVRPASEQRLNEFKLSWLWPRATAGDVERLKLRLIDAGVPASVHYTNDVFLDAIPARAGKGSALAWLCDRIGVDIACVLVAGASGNNADMFRLSGVRGILVGNASRELFASAGPSHPFIAPTVAAEGVMAGLRHFGVWPASESAAAVSSLHP